MSFEACARIVETADPERFAAAMAVPLPARRVLMPIYAMNAEVSRAPWVTQEAMIAEMRLQWWRDALEEIATGASVRRHEVTTPLSEVLTPEAAKMLDQAVVARQWDIYRDPFENWAALETYVSDTAGRLLEAAAMSLGSVTEGRRAFGSAVGLARFFAAVPALKEQGRQPLPHVSQDIAHNGIKRAQAALRLRGGGPECVEGCLAAPRLKSALIGSLDEGLPEFAPLKRSMRLARASLGWLNYAT